MPTPQEEQVNANLDLLLSQFEKELASDPVAQTELRTKIEKVRTDYQTAAADAKSSKYSKDAGEAIAKALPTIVKGAMAASDAFRKGDYISGSAALMDICAGIIPVLASLASASGPAGALVGALFSVVGQILSYFAPKQPSVTDKIKEMLDHVQSENEIERITAFGSSVAVYTDGLNRKAGGEHRMSDPAAVAGTVALTSGSTSVTGTGTAFTSGVQAGQWLTFDADATGTTYKILSVQGDTGLTLSTPYAGATLSSSTAKVRSRTVLHRGIPEILAMPLTTEAEADDFIVAMYALGWGLETNQAKLVVPVFEHKKVAAYLTRVENQRKDGWPEVLGIWCRTYADLLTANTMLGCLADPVTLDRLLAETRDGNTASSLPKEPRRKCHEALIQLKALMEGLRESWGPDNAQVLSMVRALRPVAKERGTYARLDTWTGRLVLYVARGDGTNGSLSWDYKKNTAWLRALSVHVPRSQRDSFAPRYELLALAEGGDSIQRHVLDATTGNISDGTTVIIVRDGRGETFTDLSAMAFNEGTIGMEVGVSPQTLVSLSVEESGPAQYLNYYTVDKDGKGVRVDTEPRLAGATTVRSLYLPAAPLPGDPDAQALTDAAADPPGPALTAQNTPIAYGGVRDRNVLHVVAWNSWAEVDGPQNWRTYTGVALDPYYVWVFGKGGIACATHASMIRCRQQRSRTPAWIYHDFPAPFKTPEVESLSVSADGTLAVSLQGEVHTADYTIDRGKNRVLTTEWTARGGGARQVVKLPVPCWPVLESLRTNLEATP
ncbi:hypothetical protein FHX52_4089 [Humibacillus xanthopallidus]|uniref:Uncharacterized protein n=1 Tax=Humibacillus xanthopallidus TaxID=412689 RepID=A0A543PLB4_9MICO|nr:hypothetical protein [Humibacillus xanthopallidus]TQN44868.1 hypothetical protein FHX52_4089 [Humibacillus xanthopallidus]